MLEPHMPDRPDDLKQRYLQASAEQAIGPSEKVRRAALAYAQAVAAGTANEVTMQLPQVAANRSRWNTPLVASLAIASISALLALQFDRGERADKQVVLGTPSVTARSESASATAPSASAPAPAPEPAQALPPQATAEVPPQPAAALPAPALPALTLPARALPAPSQVTPTKSEPAAKRATPPDASIAQPAAPAPAPAPAPEPASTAAKSTASADKVEPAPAKPGAAGLASGSENMTADRAASGRLAAPQSKAAPSLDAERNGQASARSDSSSADAPAAMRSRPAVAAPAPGPATAPAPISAPAVPAPAPAAAPAAPPLDAGAALREAARTGQSGALAQALQVVSAAQLNSTDSAGRTALMLATTGGHVEAVQRLVNAGANTELKDANGQTAAQTAKRLGYRQIESILKGS